MLRLAVGWYNQKQDRYTYRDKWKDRKKDRQIEKIQIDRKKNRQIEYDRNK